MSPAANPPADPAADRATHGPAVPPRLAYLAFAVLAIASACGGKAAPAERPVTDGDAVEFECRERRAAYLASGGFAGPGVGVVMDCDGSGPRIESWRVLGDNGDRATSEHSLTPAEFDRVWEDVAATGWRNWQDCPDVAPEEGDLTYKIGVKDETLAISVTCIGKTLEFPYNRLIDALDVIAARYSR